MFLYCQLWKELLLEPIIFKVMVRSCIKGWFFGGIWEHLRAVLILPLSYSDMTPKEKGEWELNRTTRFILINKDIKWSLCLHSALIEIFFIFGLSHFLMLEMHEFQKTIKLVGLSYYLETLTRIQISINSIHSTPQKSKHLIKLEKIIKNNLC